MPSRLSYENGGRAEISAKHQPSEPGRPVRSSSRGLENEEQNKVIK